MSRSVWRALLAVLLVLGAVVGVSGPTSAAAPRTTIVIAVTGCEGCTVGINRGDEWDWASPAPAQVVQNGVVRFVVPRSQTLGIAMYVQDPNAVRTNANSYAVFRYGNQRVGATFTRRQAMSSRSHHLCSAAVRRATVRWHLRVARVASRDFITGQRGYDVRPYFSPGLRTFGTAYPGRGRAGVLVNGDFFCKQRG